MDFSSVHQVKSKGMKRGTRKRKNNNNNNLVKVVYISSPMKVKTCASNFRALVQELTGRDSDLSRFTDLNAASYDASQIMDFNAESSESSGRNDRVVVSDLVNDDEANVNFRPVRFDLLVVDPYRDSPTSSESLFEPFDDVLSSQMVEKLEEMFPSNLFNYESYTTNGLDVLGDYDAV